MRLSILPAIISLALSVTALPCDQGQAGDHDQITFGNELPRDEVYEYKEVEVTPKANAGLYVCATKGFKGKCIHYVTPFGKCTTISHEFPPRQSGGVSAAGPDPGSWCTLYS
ncbi:hypothetical protein BBP40_011471 [Aspergillus hancockii]|nr:hypothetical protein BBP40_011471 [Aspergillus hancockii]